MKKVLYITPAFAVCMFMGTIGLLFGFGNFAVTAWGYLLFSLLGTSLLCKGRWWGGIVGAFVGVLVLIQNMEAASLGAVFSVYYLIMALVCFRANKK